MVAVRKLALVLGAVFASLWAWSMPARAEDPGYHVLKKFEIGGEGRWDYITMDSAARRLYISRSSHVQVLDVDRGTIVHDIPNTPGVHGIAIAANLGKGFTSNGSEGTVTVFDLKSCKELDRIKVGQNPDGIIFDPFSDRVFTFNGRSRDATAIDAATGKVAGSVPLGGKPESGVSDEQGLIYVNIEDKSEIVVFDPKDLSVKHHWPLAPGKEAVGLSMDRKTRRLFSTCQNEMMVIVDADNGKIIATPKIGKGTDFCVFDPGPAFAFSSNGDGTLTIVHEEAPDKFTVVANAETAYGARTMALDTETHNILLPTAKFGPAPEKGKGQRRTIVPGTFMILVVGK